MADHTGIEWADATWNPIVGCSIVSPGCTNCYAMGMAARIEAMQPGSHYAGTTQPSKAGAVWSGKLMVAPEHVFTQPLRWRRPRRIFVNSMGDLFHEGHPDEAIDHVFAVMNSADWHTYQVLTKRSARMRAYMTAPGLTERIAAAQHEMGLEMHADMPARNIWLGVSTEDQRRADERVPDLLATPAAVRFISAEPLLGEIDFSQVPFRERHPTAGFRFANALTGQSWWASLNGEKRWSTGTEAKIDLVIAGGESGPKARPMHPDWVRSLRDQCAAAGTAFFFKQWGEWTPEVDRERDDPDWRLDYSFRYANQTPHAWLNLEGGCGFHGERFHVMRRVGKRAAGRWLDGVEHNAMPEVPA